MFRFRTAIVIVLCCVVLLGTALMLVRLLVRKQADGFWAGAPAVGLPDVATCTEVRIRYFPSALDYIAETPQERAVLSQEEIDELAAQEWIVVEDAEYIHTLVRTLASVIYDGPAQGTVRTKDVVLFACYQGDERVGSFTLFGKNLIETENAERFRCAPRPGEAAFLYPPRIQALVHRIGCLRHLLRLYNDVRRLFYRNGGPVPPPEKWCDLLTRASREAGLGSDHLQVALSCPGAEEGRCHYTLNEACKWDSPGEMVLLFETKAGWNQHGGPELFTFDNHNPKGGCVLLNDGTVKFIRTEEELHALRWR